MNKSSDLIGLKFNRLTVIEKSDKKSKCGSILWKCHCECGGVTFARAIDLRLGNHQSCGCLMKERLAQSKTIHGKTKTPVYQSWNGMKRRCLDSNHKNYHRYGERGITVCNEWLNFEIFYKDMGDPPHGFTIDRIDNEKNYNKENCRWASRTQQARNRTTSRSITWQDTTMTLAEWSLYLGIKASTLSMRINSYKWSIDRALSTDPSLRISH